jgi:hypothetical protein
MQLLGVNRKIVEQVLSDGQHVATAKSNFSLIIIAYEQL